MTIEAPLYMQEGSYSARQDRQIIDAIFTEGVVDPGSGKLAVSQRAAGANMSVDVAAGNAVINGDDAALQGKYWVRSTAVENVAIATADPTNPRIDLIILEVRDNNVTGGGFSDARLRVVAGVPAGSPAVPATPNTAIVLARVAVAAAASSIVNANITDVRPASSPASFTTTSNFEQMTTTQRNALSGPGLYAGRSIYNTTTAQPEMYNGSSWERITMLADVQVFTGSGTWTKPTGAKSVEVIVFGGGGGGMAGGIGAAASVRGGGGGGGGGSRARRVLPAASLGATEPVTVGAGGPGAAASATATRTATGSAGGTSSFGAYVRAAGGGPAQGGDSITGGGTGASGGGVKSAGSSSVTGGADWTSNTPANATGVAATGESSGGAGSAGGGTGGAGGASWSGGAGGGGINEGIGTTGSPGAGGSSIDGGPGGGAGGSVSSANVEGPGGAGGTYGVTNAQAPGGGGAGGPAGGATDGVAGTSRSGSGRPGDGGGGGGGRAAASFWGGAGGAGGIPAGGGGGGGSAVTGAAAGAGGAGGRGEVIVISFF